MAEGGDPRWMEHSVHWSLLSGLAVSRLLLRIGLGLALIRGGPRPEGPPHRFQGVLPRGGTGECVDLFDLGLLILIGTPVLHVAVLAVGWWMMGDRRFAAVALTVLALLGLSLAGWGSGRSTPGRRSFRPSRSGAAKPSDSCPGSMPAGPDRSRSD